ncbi:MAG: phage tail protein, partial [Verrucomicrobiota bacterium]
MFGSSGGLPARDKLPLGQFSQRSDTNQQATPLPYLAGQQRVGCTFISEAFDILSQSVGDGGKGGTASGTNYFASFAVAVCHGPVSKFHDLYLNGDPVFVDVTKLYSVSLTETNNVATFQTKNAHNLVTGNTVVIYNVFQPEFNGEFVVTVISATQFQYTIPGTSLINETAKAQSGTKIYAVVKLDPVSANGADHTDFTIPNFGTITIYWGTETQVPDAYLSGTSGIQHPAYRGICYIVFHQFFLGFNQTSVQNIEVVVERTPSFDWMTNQAHAVINGDCNPACIVADLLLNPRVGLDCDPVADVNTATLDAFAEQCFLENAGLSPLITRSEELRSQLTSLLEVVDAGMGLDADGRLALVMNRVSNAPVAIGDAQLAALPNFKPADWSSVINETRLTFIDRDSGWQPDFVEWKDNAGIYAKDRPDPQTLDRQMVTHRDLALLIVSIAGPVAALPACDGTLKLTFDAGLFSSLAPGAAIAFTTSLRPVMNGVYRVTSRTWNDPSKPDFEVEVSIDRSYLYTQAMPTKLAASKVAMASGQFKSNAIIQAPATPDLAPLPAGYSRFALVELPVGLCPNNKPAIAALVARDTQGMVSAQLFLGRNFVFNGDPPDSFFMLKAITRFAFHGTLAADFAAATAFTAIANALPAEATDNPFPLTDGLALQLDGPDIILPDVSDFDALANTLLL